MTTQSAKTALYLRCIDVCGCAIDDALGATLQERLIYCRRWADTGEEGSIDGAQLEALITEAESL